MYNINKTIHFNLHKTELAAYFLLSGLTGKGKSQKFGFLCLP